MNKKNIIVVLIVVGVLGLIATGVFAYLNINESNQAEVVEQTEEPETKAEETSENEPAEAKTIAKGEFKDGDAIHKGEGTAEIVEENGQAKLEFKDFSVTKGPDVYVYLSPNAEGEDLGDFVSLGKIKSFDSDHSYNLPENYQDYKTVVIWCRAFSVTFATAELE